MPSLSNRWRLLGKRVPTTAECSAGAPPGKMAFRFTPGRGSKPSKSGCVATACATSPPSTPEYNPPAHGTRSWESPNRTATNRTATNRAATVRERSRVPDLPLAHQQRRQADHAQAAEEQRQHQGSHHFHPDVKRCLDGASGYCAVLAENL